MPDPALDEVTGFFAPAGNVRLFLLRLDLLHPVISGNKWFKLKHNLALARQQGHTRLLTFGGAYSNHLIAAAAAASLEGMACTGIVRGFHGQARPTATLAACAGYGMQLHFVSRADYARNAAPAFLDDLQRQFGPCYIIPEGGDNAPGRAGTGELAAYIPASAKHVCVPVGTGTTLAGLRSALPPETSVTGFPAAADDRLEARIAAHIPPAKRSGWRLDAGAVSGGFARTTPGLIRFIRSFYTVTGIPLDIVYTGKMMLRVEELLREGAFPAGAQIVCIHTGGLQGNPPDLFA